MGPGILSLNDSQTLIAYSRRLVGSWEARDLLVQPLTRNQGDVFLQTMCTITVVTANLREKACIRRKIERSFALYNALKLVWTEIMLVGLSASPSELTLASISMISWK